MSGTVSSGVGLVSGINYSDLITKLLTLDSQPYLQLQNRIKALSTKQSSYDTVAAALNALQSSVSDFDTSSFFNQATATSGNPDVLSATAAVGALPGAYSFRIQSLVTNHQLISGGFADSNRTPVGSGTLSFEIGNGKIARTTFLDDLNGQNGVHRGVIKITDRSGQSAQIDLSEAMTIDDVLKAINRETRISVQASVSGDHIVLKDTSGGPTTNNLSVAEVADGTMAEDLGIRGNSDPTGTIAGRDINTFSEHTSVRLLNDGNGVRHNTTGADLVFQLLGGTSSSFNVELNERMDDFTHLNMLNNGNGVDLGKFKVTTRDGTVTVVDLTPPDDPEAPPPPQTVEQIVQAINAKAGGKFEVTLNDAQNRLEVKDLTTGKNTFKIEDVDGTTAGDLGITTDATDDKIVGAEVYRISTMGDVVRAINYAQGNYDAATGAPSSHILASVSDDGNGITLKRVGEGAADGFSVERGTLGSGTFVSYAADDLGILGTSTGDTLTSRRLIAGLNTVFLRSLNGGKGVDLSNTLDITAKNGTLLHVDLSGSESVVDVIQKINDQAQTAGLQIRATYNSSQNGLAIVDETTGTGTLSVADNATARNLGLAGSTTRTTLNGTNLQLQYISETMLVADLNNGQGIGTGKFSIRNTLGKTINIQVSDNQKTVGDVIRLINSMGNADGVYARINDTGDGILLYDVNDSDASTMEMKDVSGTVASKLHLTGSPKTVQVEDPNQAGQFIDAAAVDGSYEFKINVDADSTLQDVVSRINQAGFGVSAAIINDGSSANPYRLSLTSGVTGTRGELTFDGGTTGLSMSTLVKAQDAVVIYGDGPSAIVVRSSTNSLSNVINNVTINLKGTSDEPVSLTIGNDVDSVVAGMQAFVKAYNDAVGTLDDLTSFDTETYATGPLWGESAVSTIRSRLSEILNHAVRTDDGVLRRLWDVGIEIVPAGEVAVDSDDNRTSGAIGGTQIQFNEERFRERFAQDPDLVKELFTLSETVTETRTDSSGNEVPVLNASGQPKQTFKGLGLGYYLNDVMTSLTNTTDGVLTRAEQTLQKQQDALNTRSDEMLQMLESKRARLQKQFDGLEQSLAALQNQQTAISSMLSVWTSNSSSSK